MPALPSVRASATQFSKLVKREHGSPCGGISVKFASFARGAGARRLLEVDSRRDIDFARRSAQSTNDAHQLEKYVHTVLCAQTLLVSMIAQAQIGNAHKVIPKLLRTTPRARCGRRAVYGHHTTLHMFETAKGLGVGN